MVLHPRPTGNQVPELSAGWQLEIRRSQQTWWRLHPGTYMFTGALHSILSLTQYHAALTDIPCCRIKDAFTHIQINLGR